MKITTSKPVDKIIQKLKLSKTKTVFIVGFAVVGGLMAFSSSAANNVTVSVDFSTLNDQSTWHRYEQNHIRLQKNGGAPDAELLAAINTENERSFVRLDRWRPEPGQSLETEHFRYGLGDSWLEEMNERGVAPWLTQEVAHWKEGDTDWYINPPFSQTEYDQYEDLWYDIVSYVKATSPQTTIVESFNEPNCSCSSRDKKINTQEAVELYIRNARVVNRINSEQNLPQPGSPALVSGGPAFIPLAFYANSGQTDFEEWLDLVYAASDFEEIKPSFLSYHNFTDSKSPKKHGEIAEIMRAYMDDPKFNGVWDDVPIWSSAYNPGDPFANESDPDPNESARWVAGFAAVHYFMMEADVENASMFTQNNYRNYNSTIILPLNQSQFHRISYYAPGKKTPLYNYYQKLSEVNGQRVAVSGGTLNDTGLGYGSDAVRSNDKAWIIGWQYNYNQRNGVITGPSPDNDITYTINGLSEAGISDDESAIARIYVIDSETSNIAHGDNTQDDLELVETQTLSPGATRQLYLSTSGHSTVFIEITGNNDGAGGGEDTVVPTVSLTSPDAHTTLSGNTTIRATATDNVELDRVEFFVDGNLLGTDANTNDDTFILTFDTTALSDGNHDFTARAYDTSGNSTVSDVLTLNIDNKSVTDTCDPSSVTAPAGNLASNYSYEVPNDGLNPIGTAVYGWSSAEARSGNCSAQISSTNASGSETNQRYVIPVGAIAVTPGVDYSLEGWAKTDSVGGNVSIRVNFWSGTNGATDFISAATSVSNKISGTNDWTQLDADTITAPSEAQYARVELRMGGSGTAWFDDVSLIASGDTTDSTPPDVTITTSSNEIAESGSFEITIEASDDTAVDRIELRRVDNGDILDTDTDFPYALSFPVSVPNGDYDVEAVAYDSAGNLEVSSTITVKIRNPDIDRSGSVAITDLATVIGSWTTNGVPYDIQADLNDDNVVGFGDLIKIIQNWTIQ